MSVKINDDHRKVAFAFVQMLKDLEVADKHDVDDVAIVIGKMLDLDVAGTGGQFDTGVNLVEVFKKAVADKENNIDGDEKFIAFLDLLKKKGYFKDAEEGSAEYKSRVEKAKAKFHQRNNPYEGLSAEQIKAKGNELMGQAKYKEAIAYYTKAIEMEPVNHIFYANRAAAHTHLKDYRSAIIDCEKSISLNESYSKAYSRLGTALFYDGNYRGAVTAYAKACELEPDNETYKADLKQAEEKLASSGQAVAPAAGGFPGMPGGFPGFPGMPGMPGMPGAPGGPDFGQMMQMMNNPQFMQMAQNMMANPEFSGMVQNMAKSMGMAAPTPDQIEAFTRNMGRPDGPPEVDEDGNIMTPFGKINKARLEQLQNEKVRGNPKFEAIMLDVRNNGMAAFQRYMGDPEVMQLMQEFTVIMQQEAARNAQ